MLLLLLLLLLLWLLLLLRPLLLLLLLQLQQLAGFDYVVRMSERSAIREPTAEPGAAAVLI